MEILEKFRADGVFPDLTNGEITKLAATFYISGPIPEDTPYIECAITPNALVSLGAPGGKGSNG